MTIWRLTWQTALMRRRLFIWNVLIPLGLLTPVALSEAAAPHRTAVFGVFIVFFATFGAAIPTVRDARAGWLDAVFQTGYSRRSWFGESIVGGATLDMVQLLPVVVLLALTAGEATAIELVRLSLALALVLLAANAVGVFLASVVMSLAEAALASAAVSLILLHLSGFFRTPVPGWTENVARLMPYRPLREALADVQTASGAVSADWLPALGVAALLLLGLLLGSTIWTRRFEWPRSG